MIVFKYRAVHPSCFSIFNLEKKAEWWLKEYSWKEKFLEIKKTTSIDLKVDSTVIPKSQQIIKTRMI